MGTSTQSSLGAVPAVFTANVVSGKIAAYSTGAEGIQPTVPAVSTPGAPPIAVAATADARQLFALTSSGTILLYTTSSDGSLQPANGGQPLEKVPNALSMAIAPSGSLLFVASSRPATLHVFDIRAGENGGVALALAVPASVSLAAGQPTQILVASDSSRIAVASGSGGVDILALDAASGAVSGRVHLAPLHGGKDTSVAFGEGSRTLYVAETGAGIRALTLGPSGSFDAIAGSPFAGDAGVPSSLVFQPSGNVLYAAYPSTREIVSYRADASGALSKIAGIAYAPQGTLTALSLDAGGWHLFAVASDTSSTLQVFNIGSDGKLQAIAPSGTGAAQ
jgi:6-phosphogluconolactonase (cycloisomerase 2 family)